MKIVLTSIESEERRTTAEVPRGHVLEQFVDLRLDGVPRRFRVFVKANPLPGFDASLVYGDSYVEELLRFDSAALNTLYRIVGQYRRGVVPPLPFVLHEAFEGERRGDAAPPLR